MASLKLALAVALCLAVSSNAQMEFLSGFTCPTGWTPDTDQFQSEVTCAPDPCFGGACGTGSSCMVRIEGFSGLVFPVNRCNCGPPSVRVTINFRDFCFVRGTDVCNPNPCQNGSTCRVLTESFSGLPGGYECFNCRNFFGRNCDIPGPVPTPTPKGLPAGGPNPYTTF